MSTGPLRLWHVQHVEDTWDIYMVVAESAADALRMAKRSAWLDLDDERYEVEEVDMSTARVVLDVDW